MTKKIFTFSFIIFFLTFIHLTYQFFHAPLVKQGVTTSIKVHKGQRIDALSQRLSEKKIIQHPTFFKWMVILSGNSFKLHYGEYQITYPMTASQLLRHMIVGKDLVKYRFTIVEGWTFNDIRAELLKDTNLSQTLSAETNQIIMQKLNASEAHPEGLFYPDTYFFTWGNTDSSVLKTAYQKMQTILQAEWQNRAPNLPYKNAYQALIAASLIERETPIAAEKPLISSVILNRLKKHMRLQIDPTVEYGLKKSYFKGITKKELEIKTPYNTYLVNGLPPTPICMPSESSIHATLHPDKTDYYYYVATGKGGHHFSKTYEEHLKQVKEYRMGVGVGVGVGVGKPPL